MVERASEWRRRLRPGRAGAIVGAPMWSEPTAVPAGHEASEPADFDVVVVGGGVNGTGVARDAALRGLRVALVEKHDLGFGASGNSSGMIHGGPRYLLGEPHVTEQSCRDSGYVQRIAPHLLFRIPFLMPVAGRGPRAWLHLLALDAFFAYYDHFQPLKRGRPHTRLSAEELRRLEPGLQGEFVGAVTFDEWGIDGHRLCTLNALDAAEHGALVLTHTEATGLLRGPQGEARGVEVRDRLTGAVRTLKARAVVHATGAWSPAMAERLGVSLRLRPGKGIHVVFDRRFSNYAVVAEAVDGRQIFVMPWQNLSWVGTTDDDYYGEPDRIRAVTDEVRYLLQGVGRLLPEAAEARVVATTAGVRPTLYGWGRYEDELSREHALVDHAAEGTAGLFSMIGGKLASFRIFAEEATDALCAHLGVSVRCTTHERPLPGGERVPEAAVLGERFELPLPVVQRLVDRHGARAERILERVARDREEARLVCTCEPVTVAEVRHVAEQEFVRTLADLSRRTRLGTGACGGRCALHAARLCGEVLGWETARIRREAASLLAARYRSALPALHGEQLAQWEMLAGWSVGSGLPALPLSEDEA